MGSLSIEQGEVMGVNEEGRVSQVGKRALEEPSTNSISNRHQLVRERLERRLM